MTFDLHLIDAFADGPFTGNPAAVVLLEDERPDTWMQQVAMEMNQAETAFLRWESTGWSLRWFTPMAEVDLCGHATVASAHFLWQEGHVIAGAPILFHTRSGVLTAEQDERHGIVVDFPAIASHPVEPPADLIEALGVTPHTVLHGDFDLLCVVADGAVVRSLRPDLGRIASWDVRGVLVTAAGDRPGIDYITRCFFPALGIPEDPVTGSAHCALAPYWGGVLQRSRLVAYQASRRGGTLHCETSAGRVRLTGRAVTTVRGQLDA